MQIKYVKNKNIDKKIWDKTVFAAYNGLIYGCSWFLDNLADDWDAVIVGDYEYILPLPFKKKFLLRGVNKPVFVQLNNIYGKQKPDTELVIDILGFIRKKFFTINLFFSEQDNIVLDGYKQEILGTQILHANSKYEDLYSNFTKLHKKNIRKAKNKNVLISKTNDINSLILMKEEVYKIKNLKYSAVPYIKLSKVIDYNLKYHGGEIYDALLDGKLIASAFFAKFKNVYTLFSGNSMLARKTGAGYLIINKFIETHANENFYIDFAGSNIENIANWNIGFGAKKQNYYHIEKNNKILSFLKMIKR